MSEQLPVWVLNMAPLKEFVFGLVIVLFILIEPKGLAEIWRIIRFQFPVMAFFVLRCL